ncbi:MAG: ABC transporter substrate-binding protein [Anaerolineales bacterium]
MGAEEEFAFSVNEGSVLQQFTELHPEIVVDFAAVNPPAPGQDWYTALAENADCFTWFSPDAWDAQTTAQLLNLSPLIEREGKEWVEDYYPGLVDGYRYEGELYGLPAVAQPEVMYYNVDLLAQRGLQPPPMDWTFDDFIQLVNMVSAEEIYGYFSPIGDPFFFNGRGTPGYHLNTSPPVIEFDTPEMVNTLKWMVELYQAGGWLPFREVPWEESTVQQLVAGKVVFWTSPAGSPGRYNLGEPFNYQIGAAPLPLISDTSVVGYAGLKRGFFISRQAAHPEACWTWIKFLSAQPATFSGIPPRQSVAESPAWEALVGKENAIVYRAALENLSQTGSQNDLLLWSPLEVWRSQALSAALQGANPEQLLAEAQHKAEIFVACMANVNPNQMTRQEVQERTNSCAKQADPQGDW